jgi:hypothetical protein
MSRFNFKDWNIKEWLYGNKEFFKIVIPAVIAFLVTNDYMDTALASIITKPILDIIEYFIKE